MYDAFILVLMIVGISTVVVFSYKIFHSRVYPVGIVRSVPAAQEYAEDASAEPSNLATDFNRLMAEGCSVGDIANNLHLSEQDVKHYIYRVKWDIYSKRRFSSQIGKQQYRLAVRYRGQKPSDEPETDPDLKKEVSEHGEALKLHDELFKDIEQRMRKLEVETVQKLQEAAEETPQPPQAVN